MTGNYCAVYDFDLMPYALGDVLTWNVQTAILAREAGHEAVDVHVCMDERFPASIYQKGLVTPENCGLFLNELFGAFGTHPCLGNLYFYRQRETMFEALARATGGDSANAQAVDDYHRILAKREDNDALVAYFTKYIYYHERINAYAAEHGKRIPYLRASMGCDPDVLGLVKRRFAGKKIVPFHLRLRRLDAGYAGEHTYARDSDFLAWHEFLTEAVRKHPDVQFVALGRLQEKPLELLRLPNVMSLRTWGLGLGHDLTLMLHGDLFMGTSSGFAAMANFSEIPYFITKMNKESCNAYRIDFGAEHLPFGSERQVLVYEPESKDLLLRLLERGLADAPPRDGEGPRVDPVIDVRSWEWERAQWLYPSATTARFHANEAYSDKETAFLLWPKVREARMAWRREWKNEAWRILKRLEASFPAVCDRFPEFLRLRAVVAVEHNEWITMHRCKVKLRRISKGNKGVVHFYRMLRRYFFWGYPTLMHAKFIWRNRQHIPRRLRQIAGRFTRFIPRRSQA